MKRLLTTLFFLPLLALSQGYPVGAGYVISYSQGAPCVPATPIAPTILANDDANTLSASHALGTGEILVSANNSAYVQYVGIINVPDADLPAGYYKFKTKAASCRNESPVVQSPAFSATNSNPTGTQPAPTFYVDYPEIQHLEFVKADGLTNASDYELSVNSGATWTTLSDTSAYKYVYESATWSGRFRVWLGNAAHAAGTVKIRTKAAGNLSASAAITNQAAYAFITNFDRYKPLLLLNHEGIATNLINVVAPVGVPTHFKSFQYTTDGGGTAQPFGYVPQWIPNQNISVGNLGVRSIDAATGTPRSGWRFSTVAIPAHAEPAVTVTGLKEFNPSVTGTINDDDSVLTLSSNAYNFQVGEWLVVGNEGAPGGGLRGTRGTDGEWPYRRAPDSAWLAANTTSFVTNEYVWTESDGKARRKGSDGSFPWYAPTDVDKDFAMPIAARRQVIGVQNGGTRLLLNQRVKQSATATAIYPDNSVILNSYRSSTYEGQPYYFASITIPPGTYPIARRVDMNGTGVKINAGGVTLFSPKCVESASFGVTGYGTQLNPTGTGYLTVKGNYLRQGFGFRAFHDDGSRALPTIEPFLPDPHYLYLPGIQLQIKGGTARNIDAWDALTYGIQAYGCGDLQITGAKSRHTAISEVSNAGNVPYFGSYAWFIHTSSSLNVSWDFLNDTAFTSPKLINGVEAFNSQYVVYKNGIMRNGHGANNGTSHCVVSNLKFFIDSNSRTFQNSGHPLWEGNNFMNFSGDVSKNRYENLEFHLAGSIDAAIPNSYPIGLFIRDNSGQQFQSVQTGEAGVIIKNILYTRPDFNVSVVNSGWYGSAVRAPALGLDLDGVTATGNYTSTYLNAWGITENTGGSVQVFGSDASANIRNVTVPTASIPMGNSITNVTTTEATIRRPALLVMEANKTITGTSTTVSKLSQTLAPGTTQALQGWSCVEASKGDAGSVIITNGSSNTATVSNLQSGGVYVFKIFVRDSLGADGAGFVKVTVL